MSARYRTIVADPPWDHSDGTGFSFGNRDPRGRSGQHSVYSTSLPYGVMTVEEIAALPVSSLAESDAALYLWTTSRYLRAAYDVASAWDFKPSALLIWCKPANQGLFGGTFLSNVEFVLHCRRGCPETLSKVGTRWFTWPRGRHSAKPEAFIDMVEQVSPPPYVELFARRHRLGWDVWGNESANTATLEAI